MNKATRKGFSCGWFSQILPVGVDLLVFALHSLCSKQRRRSSVGFVYVSLYEVPKYNTGESLTGTFLSFEKYVNDGLEDKSGFYLVGRKALSSS